MIITHLAVQVTPNINNMKNSVSFQNSILIFKLKQHIIDGAWYLIDKYYQVWILIKMCGWFLSVCLFTETAHYIFLIFLHDVGVDNCQILINSQILIWPCLGKRGQKWSKREFIWVFDKNFYLILLKIVENGRLYCCLLSISNPISGKVLDFVFLAKILLSNQIIVFF